MEVENRSFKDGRQWLLGANLDNYWVAELYSKCAAIRNTKNKLNFNTMEGTFDVLIVNAAVAGTDIPQ